MTDSQIPSANSTGVYRRQRNASFTRFGEEGLLVVPGEAMQIVLNDTASRVFELLGDGVGDVEALALRLAEEYESADAASLRSDVVEILEDLRRRGAVELAD